MSSTDLPGFAILGAGIFATEAHLPAVAKIGPAAPPLKAIYSRSLKSAASLAEAAKASLTLPDAPAVYHDGDPTASLDVLLARPDITAVLLVLPICTQPDIIRRALAAGKHVLSEKPVAPDVAAGAELIRTYEAEYKPKGLVWRVAENFATEPIYQRAAQLVREGAIGEVKTFKARVCNYADADSKWYKTPWRTVPDYQGGFLLDGGVHFAAALRIMLPSPLTSLSAIASLNKPIFAPHDTIHALLRTASGAHGIFEVTFAAPAPAYAHGNGFTLTGTAGWLHVGAAPAQDGKPSAQRVVVHRVSKDGKEDAVEEIDEEVRGIEAELLSFFRAVAGQDDGLQGPRDALQDVAVIEAALNSDGKPVDLAALATV
ncbi:NAD(P)-binding protein [Dentipellis sp. KUC8613]|nr:NAD(P)-binding protein [Dentipellis sp. KUC8613]